MANHSAQGARAPPPLNFQIGDFSNSTISYKINPPVPGMLVPAPLSLIHTTLDHVYHVDGLSIV